jgi:flagellar protein FliS
MVPNARATYINAAVTTASPARLLVMLCERLVLDTTRAAAALESGDSAEAHNQFLHAQEIVTNLMTSLDPAAFRGGNQVMALYRWLSERLVKANITKDTKVARECETLAAQICDMWREAALAAVSA